MNIKLYSTTLNMHREVHPVANYFCDTIVRLDRGFSWVNDISQADLVVISCPACTPFVFDHSLASSIRLLQKKIILIDESDRSNLVKDDFLQFIIEIQDRVVLSFWRECIREHKPPHLFGRIVPWENVSYLSRQTERDSMSFPLQTKEAYKRRKFDWCFIGGVTSESRKMMFDFFEGDEGTNFFLHDTSSENDRINLRTIFDFYFDSKIVLSLEGAGAKCTRHLEAPFASLMMKESSSFMPLNYTYPWVSGFNCFDAVYKAGLSMKPHIHVESTMNKIQNLLDDLDVCYEIYRRGRETAEKYRIPVYYREHIIKNILDVI